MATMYTVQEAADYLNVSRKTIYKWIKDGSLKAQKLGKRLYRIDEFDLYTFIRPVTYQDLKWSNLRKVLLPVPI